MCVYISSIPPRLVFRKQEPSKTTVESTRKLIPSHSKLVVTLRLPSEKQPKIKPRLERKQQIRITN